MVVVEVDVTIVEDAVVPFEFVVEADAVEVAGVSELFESDAPAIVLVPVASFNVKF